MDNDRPLVASQSNVPAPQQPLPGFIYGLAFLISTILSSGVSAYLAVQSSVDKYIEAQHDISIEEIKLRARESNQDSDERRRIFDEASEERRLLRDELSNIRAKLGLPAVRGAAESTGKATATPSGSAGTSRAVSPESRRQP